MAERISESMRWNTDKEIDFLRKLGKHRKYSPTSRLELLERYLENALKRENWGKLDSARIISATKKFIQLEI